MLNFTLTDLKYLLALAEEKHFAKAAARCFISQPTLSIAIKKLEENLEICIFERENHQILLTPAGNMIIEQAKKILGEAQQMREMALSYQNPYSQPLRIGAILTIGPYLFPSLVRDTIKLAPELKLILEEGFTTTLTAKLLTGELDAIILATPITEAELEQTEIFQDELSLICSAKHKLAPQAKILPKVLNDETLLLLGNGNCLRDQVLQVCKNNTVATNNISNQIISSSLETIKYMVEMNIGVSILPKIAQINLPANLVVKPFSASKKPTRTLSIVTRKNFPRKSLVKLIEQQLIAQLVGS
jgi:LysR family hydrogen peroxide-inducible transcriptional activator